MTFKQAKTLQPDTKVFWSLDGEIFELTKRASGGFYGIVPVRWSKIAIHVPPSKDVFLTYEEAVETARQQIISLRQQLDTKTEKLRGDALLAP